MPVQIIITPPAGGKTQAVIEQLLAVLHKQPLAAVWVVLPDRLQASHFRRRLAAAGGALGVQVGTFGNLYQDFLERAGRPVTIAPDPISYRLIQAAMDDVFDQGRLIYFQQLRTMPGFASALRNLFAEFKRALVDPEDLLEAAQTREPAFLELAEIYVHYQTRLQALNWADTEGLSWLAVEALGDDPTLGRNLQLLVVDGFDSFVASQLQALKLLAGRVNAITITLPGGPRMQRLAHRRFSQELEKLQIALQTEIHAPDRGPFLPEALAGLQQAIFETDAAPLQDAGQISLMEARSPSEECREALRWLKARLVRDGLRAGDCALVVPDIEAYRPYLRMAASEFGMALRFTLEEPLIAAPSVALLLDLLELPLQGYPRRMTLDTLRSPYLNLSHLGLGPEQADALDVASLFGQVVAGLPQWFETLDDLAKAQLEVQLDPEDAENSSPILPKGLQAARLRDSLAAFASRLAPPIDRLGMPEWVRWLEDLLEDLGFLHNAAIERDESARLSLQETFRALGMSSAIAGSRSLDYAAFVGELQGVLQGARYGGTPERVRQTRPAIVVLRMLEARGVRFQAVAMLGLAEGVYPQTERTDPFFNEKDRRSFGLEPRLGRQQAGVFYQALARADRFLLLTRPYLAADGEPWEPSPYWNEVRKLLPVEASLMVRPDDPRRLEEAGSPQEFLFWAVKDAVRFEKGLSARYQDLRGRWQMLRHARTVLQARLARTAAGPFEGMPDELREVLGERYGAKQIWSASRLETYGSCPFRFYVEVALGLQAKQPPQFGLDASQLGSLLHAVLEQAYRQASDSGDPERVLAALHQIAPQAFQTAPQNYGFRPSVLWDKQQQIWLAALEETIQASAEYDPSWKPEAYEARFGLEEVPALEIQSEAGPIWLRGVIDRIDRNSDGELRVVDYKTGGSHLTPADLINGVRLQLPLYALAAERALHLGKAAEGLYWKILKAEPGSLKLSSFNYDDAYYGVDGACELVAQHVSRFVTGIRLAEYPPEPPKGGCPRYCAAAAWCWRYSPSSY